MVNKTRLHEFLHKDDRFYLRFRTETNWTNHKAYITCQGLMQTRKKKDLSDIILLTRRDRTKRSRAHRAQAMEENSKGKFVM